MVNSKKKKNKGQCKQKKPGWLKVNKEVKRAEIPVGPRFQAEIPDCAANKPPFQNGGSNDNSDDTLKWFGEPIWPPTHKGTSMTIDDENIGKGRSADSCRCTSPGSTECVKQHVMSEQARIHVELGPVFAAWKFDKMGENVSNSWSNEEEEKFKSIVKMNPVSQDCSFLKPAVNSFPSKTVYDIVEYYLNVFIPRRISMKCRSGVEVLYSDDDEDDNEDSFKVSRKRCSKDGVGKVAKSRCLRR